MVFSLVGIGHEILMVTFIHIGLTYGFPRMESQIKLGLEVRNT